MLKLALLFLTYQVSSYMIAYFPSECPLGWKKWENASGRFIFAAGVYKDNFNL